jgi:hypothetical protein
MELFIVPVGVEADGRYLYQAVFNRLLPRTEESE